MLLTELDVFRYFLKFPKVYSKFSTVLKGMNLNFTHPAIKTYWEWVDYYFKKYNSVPPWEWLYYATDSSYQLGDSQKDYLKETLTGMTQSNLEINYDQVFGFFLEKDYYTFEQQKNKADWSNYDQLLQETKQRAEFLESIRNPDKINNFVDEIIMPFSKEWMDQGWDLLHEIKTSCISTGHTMLDFMTGGGFPLGTINCVHGKSNGGKTLIMGDQCVGHLRNTDFLRVVLFALDVNTKPMVTRIYCNAGNIPINTDFNKDIYNHRLKMGVKENWEYRFFIVRWPRGQRSVKDMIECVEKIQDICRPIDIQSGVDPEIAGDVDVIWTDSINNVRHPVSKYNPDKRHQYDESLLQMAAFAETHGKVWNFTAQANRFGNYVDNLTDEYLGEHHGIRHHCSMLMSLQQNKEDKITKNIRIAMNKVKALEGDWVMHFHYDKATMSIRFDETRGITYEDGSPHPEWVKLHPEHAHGKIQSGGTSNINSIQPKKRKKVKGGNASYNLPVLPFG